MAAVAVAVGLLFVSGTARAQGRLLDDRPTLGTLVPVSSLVGDPDAAAVEVNPALMGFLRSWNLMYVHTEMDPDGSRPGTGDALFWAQRIPWVPLSYGLGVQYLRWPDAFGPCYGKVGKLSAAVAYRLDRWLGLGAAYHWFVGPGSEGLGSVGTWELAAVVRPFSPFAFGMKVSDLAMPKGYGGMPLQRTWDFELGFRPLGTPWWTVSLGVRVGERRETADPRIRVEAEVWRGLVVRGDLEYRHRDLELDTDGFGDRLINDFRATVGVEVNFSRFGFGLAAAFGRNLRPLPGGVFHGMSGTLRLSGESYRSVYPGSDRVVLLKLPTKKTGQTEYVALVRHMQRMARDRRVKGVLLKVEDSGPGWGMAEELRGLIKRLRGAGKKVIAYVKTPSTQAYYVASACDRVWLFPGGGLQVTGLSVTRLYFKTLLDRLGVRVQVLKYAAYKTAPEPLVRKGPSPEAARVSTAVLGEFYGRFLSALAERKKVGSVTRASEVMKSSPFTSKEAVTLGLVDALVHDDEVDQALSKEMGRRIPLMRPVPHQRRWVDWGLGPGVAVVVIEGDLVPGRSRVVPVLGTRVAGHKTIMTILRKLRFDTRIKAVVLRIESPGGVAESADLIGREVLELRKVKPVIASVGNIAASGGYQIAAAADVILAEPSALTGSIGIFAAKPDLSGLFGKAGVGVHQFRKGPKAGLWSVYRPYTEQEAKELHVKLGYYYRRFIRAVARGRKKLKFAQVEKLAGGRVWTGAQAVGNGLVDRVGDLDDALLLAAKKAGLHRPLRVVVYPRPSDSLLGRVVRGILGGRSRSRGKSFGWCALPTVRELARTVPASLVASPESGIYARIPFRLSIR